MAAFATIKNVAADRIGPPTYSTSGAQSGKAAGLVVHSAGGVLAAFIDAFSGLDGTLPLSAGLVVIGILLFVYRSPVLWFSRCSARC